MVAWLVSILTGAIAALVSILIAVGALTGVDADHEGPNEPGQGQYGDE